MARPTVDFDTLVQAFHKEIEDICPHGIVLLLSLVDDTGKKNLMEHLNASGENARAICERRTANDDAEGYLSYIQAFIFRIFDKALEQPSKDGPLHEAID